MNLNMTIKENESLEQYLVRMKASIEVNGYYDSVRGAFMGMPVVVKSGTDIDKLAKQIKDVINNFLN